MNELTTKPNTPLARPADPEALAAFNDLDPSDFEIPVLHLFQDIGNESATYGEHSKGTWIHSLTRVNVTGQEVIAVAPMKETIAWWKPNNSHNEQGIAHRFRTESEVPDAIRDDIDLDVINYTNWVFLFDDEAVIVRFKSTSLRAAKRLNTTEKSRAARGEPAGVYRLESEDQTNQFGKWKHPVFALVRDATDAEMISIREHRRTFRALVNRASDAPNEDTGYQESLPAPSTDSTPTAQPVDEADIPF